MRVRGHLEWRRTIDKAGICKVSGIDMVSWGWVGRFIHHQTGNQKAHLWIVIRLTFAILMIIFTPCPTLLSI